MQFCTVGQHDLFVIVTSFRCTCYRFNTEEHEQRWAGKNCTWCHAGFAGSPAASLHAILQKRHRLAASVPSARAGCACVRRVVGVGW